MSGCGVMGRSTKRVRWTCLGSLKSCKTSAVIEYLASHRSGPPPQLKEPPRRQEAGGEDGFGRWKSAAATRRYSGIAGGKARKDT
ncbi:hypothetical protein E2C01_091483 [Portunus trituberculatus]|uniref:Uncharacterized protein n=1 Tax=Portunus trituberculatus TaxID=210409 RepID=A0A5B7JT01_PORTR|nr:hypothetical protein [Portunus trituberculatus]